MTLKSLGVIAGDVVIRVPFLSSSFFIFKKISGHDLMLLIYLKEYSNMKNTYVWIILQGRITERSFVRHPGTTNQAVALEVVSDTVH